MKQIIRFFVLFLVAMVPWSLRAQVSMPTEIMIGSSADTAAAGYLSTNRTPLNDYWKYNLSVTLVDSYEINGGAQFINSISYYFKGDGSLTDSIVRDSVDIYIKPSTSFYIHSGDNNPLDDDDTPLFSGRITFHPGWNEIVFDQPFAYDGVSSLIIVVNDRSGYYHNAGANQYFAMSRQTRRTTSGFPSTEKMIGLYTDNGEWDPTAFNAPSSSLFVERPWMKLKGTVAVQPTPFTYGFENDSSWVSVMPMGWSLFDGTRHRWSVSGCGWCGGGTSTGHDSPHCLYGAFFKDSVGQSQLATPWLQLPSDADSVRFSMWFINPLQGRDSNSYAMIGMALQPAFFVADDIREESNMGDVFWYGEGVGQWQYTHHSHSDWTYVEVTLPKMYNRHDITQEPIRLLLSADYNTSYSQSYLHFLIDDISVTPVYAPRVAADSIFHITTDVAYEQRFSEENYRSAEDAGFRQSDNGWGMTTENSTTALSMLPTITEGVRYTVTSQRLRVPTGMGAKDSIVVEGVFSLERDSDLTGGTNDSLSIGLGFLMSNSFTVSSVLQGNEGQSDIHYRFAYDRSWFEGADTDFCIVMTGVSHGGRFRAYSLTASYSPYIPTVSADSIYQILPNRGYYQNFSDYVDVQDAGWTQGAQNSSNWNLSTISGSGSSSKYLHLFSANNSGSYYSIINSPKMRLPDCMSDRDSIVIEFDYKNEQWSGDIDSLVVMLMFDTSAYDYGNCTIYEGHSTITDFRLAIPGSFFSQDVFQIQLYGKPHWGRGIYLNLITASYKPELVSHDSIFQIEVDRPYYQTFNQYQNHVQAGWTVDSGSVAYPWQLWASFDSVYLATFNFNQSLGSGQFSCAVSPLIRIPSSMNPIDKIRFKFRYRYQFASANVTDSLAVLLEMNGQRTEAAVVSFSETSEWTEYEFELYPYQFTNQVFRLVFEGRARGGFIYFNEVSATYVAGEPTVANDSVYQIELGIPYHQYFDNYLSVADAGWSQGSSNSRLWNIEADVDGHNALYLFYQDNRGHFYSDVYSPKIRIPDMMDGNDTIILELSLKNQVWDSDVDSLMVLLDFNGTATGFSNNLIGTPNEDYTTYRWALTKNEITQNEFRILLQGIPHFGHGLYIQEIWATYKRLNTVKVNVVPAGSCDVYCGDNLHGNYSYWLPSSGELTFDHERNVELWLVADDDNLPAGMENMSFQYWYYVSKSNGNVVAKGELRNDGICFNVDNDYDLTLVMAETMGIDTLTIYDTVCPKVRLWALPNNFQYGTCTGFGDFGRGITVEVMAIPNPGYHFVRWNDGVTTPKREVTVGDHNIYIQAIFLPDVDDTLTLPYFEDFDSINNYQLRWRAVDHVCSSTAYGPYVSNARWLDNKALVLDNLSTFAMPPVNVPVNTLRLEFDYTNAMGLEVGVMTDLSDPGTFTVVRSISDTNLDIHHVVDFDEYTGSGRYIAFRQVDSDTSLCVYLYITGEMDNVALYPIPTFTTSSSNTKVTFAPGNLTCKVDGIGAPVAGTWRFHQDQYTYLGLGTSSARANDLTNFNCKVDLFGYGNSGNLYGLGYDTNDFSYNQPLFDWGSVINAEYGTGWHTLTRQEAYYILNNRVVNGGSGDGHCYVRATCNGVFGVLIFPDGYTGTVDSVYSKIPFGCAFLPAAGFRQGVLVDNNGTSCFYLLKDDEFISESTYPVIRCYNDEALRVSWMTHASIGTAVRLVKSVQ